MTTPNEFESGSIAVDGAVLAYEITGHSRPLVLIHAGIADKSMWDEQVAAWSGSHRVVRYDMRGFGESTTSSTPYSGRGDLYALLRGLGIEKATVLGCSMGGSAAIDFALEHPEMVDALVLVGADPSGLAFDPGDLAARWDEIDAVFDKGDTATATELETRMWVDGPYRSSDAVDPAFRARAYAMGLRVNERATAAPQATRLPLDPPAVERLNEVRVPTLVIVGDQDVPFIQTSADLLANGIAGARKVVMPGTAHLPSMEHPTAFNRIVDDFLVAL